MDDPIGTPQAEDKIKAVKALLRETTPEQAWAVARRSILKKADGFDLHQRAYDTCRDSALPQGTPFPVWSPTEEGIEGANVTLAARQVGCASYDEFYPWSVAQREQYWRLVSERLGIVFRHTYDHVLQMRGPTQPLWFSGTQMNIVESCFGAAPDTTAILYADGTGAMQTVSYADLQRLVGRIAAGLQRIGVQPGDSIALLLPMNASAVAIYLAIVAVGGAVVSIAESFAPAEIGMRLRIASVSLVFTQETMSRSGKTLPLYEKFVAAEGPPAVVLPSAVPGEALPLRAPDVAWDSFLPADGRFEPVTRSPQDIVNVLFSSGTTGEPKAIPWDHTTPIKCAGDAHFHHDVHPGDVLCWPTSLGWMMGPWLLFAALINRATIALYGETPMDGGFGRFVQDARVTMLGVVPGLVRAWRGSGCMEAWDWSAIRAFSSTGECSNASNMLYLSYLADYKPIIEYCGGTEIGGAYVTGTVVQPCVPATFTTPALGIEFQTFNESGQPHNPGEVFLRGPSVGLSTRLLNRDHDSIYFGDAPASETEHPWRRHGDEMEALPGGFYRMQGRCDDTMNLGGIKVSCIEIERVLDQLEDVLETAAVAASPPGGGPSRLVVFAVLRPGQQTSAEDLKGFMQQAIRSRLNPLFGIAEVRIVPALPRTASNKIVRRELREQLAA